MSTETLPLTEGGTQIAPRLAIKDHLIIILFYLILSLAYTFPLLLNMNSVTGGDGHFFVHSFWWFKKALSSFQNPFYTNYIFYPEGISLVFQSSTFSNFLLTLPLSFVAGINVAVNAAYILSYVLSGYTAFLLARDYTKSGPAAIVAGTIFAFTPFHFSHGPNHLHISTLQWIPLYLLMLNYSLKRDEWRWPIFAGMAMGAIILTDQHQAISVAIVTMLSLPFLILRRGDGWQLRVVSGVKRKAMAFLLIIATVLLVTGGYLYQAAQYLIKDGTALRVGIFDHGGANAFAGDLAAYFVPPPYHPLWGKLFTGVHPSGEGGLFFGYLPLLLVVAGVVRFRRELPVKLMILLGPFFWLISLGPTLHMNGVWQWGGEHVLLPFFWLAKLPIFADIRTPNRFHMITILAVSILAAYGVKAVLQQWATSGLRKNCLTAAIAAIILIEFLPSPHLSESGEVPAVYREMAKDNGDYAILELPLSRWSALTRNGLRSPMNFMYNQTIHGKRILNGYVSRVSEPSLDFRDAILDKFVSIPDYDIQMIETEKRMANDLERAEAGNLASKVAVYREEFLRRYKIKYIVVQAPVAVKGSLTRVFVERFAGTAMIDDGSGSAYVKLY